MIWLSIFITLIIIWAIIYPVTDYWLRFFSPVVIKKGNTRFARICLTFDDGPNPEVTPVVLEILAKNRIPATFFLVGQRAERSPELVRQILANGHEIGLHTYYHRHAYYLFLKKSITTIQLGKQALENITKQPITWFRPPWGALNMFQYLYLRLLNLKIVLWTANAADWEVRTTPAMILERLQRRVKPGSIIVIHDAGGEPGAPQNMVTALPTIIEQLNNQGYHFETLTNITGGTA